MTPLGIMEAIATVLWVYAGLAFLDWVGHLRRSDKRFHIPHVTDLLGNLVPAMIALLVVVMAGAVVGLPSVVVIIAVLFPAGLAFGVHMALNDIRGESDYRTETVRMALTFVIAAGIVYLRQIA